MNPVVLVGVGGVFGALSRHLVGQKLSGQAHGTFAVNVLGSFVLGALTACLMTDPALLTLFGTGFCGAFTTFSSFAFETVRLYERGKRREAVANATLNLVGALAAVAVGNLTATVISL
ncbi:fluoride efflux transporter CrcB [Haladaptatus pallidirubidus]|uniref:Fluoride-specific ion channel FluC n=1 Tax=Haladaptatus pallidirubidus TaxID=1008152 RepID=A0AAV3ULU4_9EURY|nr:fluoride efflux transporter CrcB [Haladaptatus pallidirubidus]